MEGRARWIGLVALGAVTLVVAPLAHAQPSSNEAAAREAFDEGTRLYGEARYLDAAHAYERAYALSPRPLLLRNVSTAYERALDMGRAADALERYLDAAHPADEAELRARVLRMRQMAGSSAGGTTPPDAGLAPPPEPVHDIGPEQTTTPPPEPPPSRIEIVEQNPNAATQVAPPPRTRAPASDADPGDAGGGVSASGLVSVVTGGVAVVMTVVGLVSGIMAIGEGAAVTQCVVTLCPATAADGISSARTLADTSTVTGSIGAGLGVLAVILAIVAASSSGDEPEEDDDEESAAFFAPGIFGGGVGARF
jgi:hypothetical protein